MSDLPKIVGVALHYRGLTISLPEPNRHHDIMRMLGNESIFARGEQGFITSEGHFLGRIGARALAADNGQKIMRSKFTHAVELFSEDLW